MALILPGAAAAEEAARTDPELGSPAEAVYGIPLEEARRDAAPGAPLEAAIRTEQGVGSSTRVPGRAAQQAGGDAEQGDERRRERRQAARAATKLSGDASAAATTVLLFLVTGLAATGGVAAGRLVGRRSRL